MNRLMIFIVGLLVLAAVGSGILYVGELDKNKLRRREALKTTEDAQEEIKKIKELLKDERDKNLESKKKLLAQLTESSKEKESLTGELETLKKRVYEERELSLVANEDVDKLRSEVAKLRTESRHNIASLEESFQKKKKTYEMKILSLDAQLSKAKEKFNSKAERYHYNLGVVYAQNKEYDLAVEEFKTALGYNPESARTHYNLGIIFDDYFKDKENARYHYRSFLALSPTSDDADSVREWLDALDR